MLIFFNDFEKNNNAKEIALKLYYKLFVNTKVVINRFFSYTVDDYYLFNF